MDPENVMINWYSFLLGALAVDLVFITIICATDNQPTYQEGYCHGVGAEMTIVNGRYQCLRDNEIIYIPEPP